MAESNIDELDKIPDLFPSVLPSISTTTVSSLPAASEMERDLARQAAKEFENGQYDHCITLLNQLSNSRGHDPKVVHNMAVVDYYKSSNMARTDEFKKVLQEICYKGRFHLDNVSNLDDVDHCILYYNHAVILYHLRQYNKALVILDKLFQLIEPMEDKLSKKVMFLLVELYLCTHQPEKAMRVLGFIEKILFGNGKAVHLHQHGEREGGAGIKGESPSRAASCNDSVKPKVTVYKVRCYMMLKSMKACKRELKGILNTGSNSQSIPITYLKSNFEFLRTNYRKAIKVLNSVQQPTNVSSEAGYSLPMIYYNNLGVIHFQLHKHNLGAFYLRKAVQENALTVKEYNTVDPTKTLSGRPINTVAISRHYELLYNMGIQLLHCGKPVAAFDCLMQTVEIYQINPLLWLRLAECSIVKHKENNMIDRQLSKRLSVIKGSEGSGVHRKLILGPGMQDSYQSVDTAGFPTVTLEFASLCLRNALMLLPEDPVLHKSPARTSESEQTDQRANPTEPTMIAAPPSNPMRASDVSNLRCSILASSAYVALCLDDHLVALQHAEQLLKQPRLSGAHKYLGHLYQAEALVALDQIAEAISHLDPDLVSDISTAFPEQKSDSEKDKEGAEQDEVPGYLYTWSPSDVPQARAIMQYNLASAHAIRGEHEKALDHLGQSSQSIGLPLPAQVYHLKIYLELMEGRRQSAQKIIKEHFGHTTPNRV